MSRRSDIVRRVASRFLKAETTPLPEEFPPYEIGLMTLDEFIEFKNPGKKHHSAESFDFDVEKLNQSTLWEGGKFQDWTLLKNRKGYLLKMDGVPIAVLKGDTLYLQGNTRPYDVPQTFFHYQDNVYLEWSSVRKVKYIDEYIPLIDDVAAKVVEDHPVVLKRVRLDGEYFTIRAAKKPKLNDQTNLAMVNQEGQRVAIAQDEWGATLLVVSQEYRGRGFGIVLGDLWYKLNPNSKSGGFTNAGRNNAVKLWKKRVREFLQYGWYSSMVSTGRIEKSRVDEILKDLGERRKSRPEQRSKDSEKKLLLYANYPTFAIYDQRFIEEQDEKYIHGFGFFRDQPSVGEFLYTVDYDRGFAELTMSVAFQMARDEGVPIYIGEGYRDFIEPSTFPKGVTIDGDYAYLEHDVLPLSTLAQKEKLVRRKKDPYQQIEYSILEMAEFKWK